MHYILTRFNSTPKDPRHSKRRCLNATWLKRRLELSKTYYKPSLLQQSCKKFKVVVACHPDSPQYVLDFFGEFAEIWFGGIGDYPYPRGSTTTRLDSDDCIHKHFVKSIGDLPQDQRRLVDFDIAQYHLHNKQIYQFPRKWNNSMFVSVIQSKPRRSCYACEHTFMHQKFTHQKRFRWIGGLQIVHGSNITTRSPAGPRMKLALSNFF